MAISKQDAAELVELIGTNWNLDPKWQEAWYTNTTLLFWATFKKYDFQVLQDCIFIILQDNTSRKIPPFAEIKQFIIKKAGESLIRSPSQKDEGCDKCTPRSKNDRGGTRRIYASISISGAPPRRFEWVARCTCARGAQNLKAYNFEQFAQALADDHAYRLLGKRDPVDFEILDYAVSVYNPRTQNDDYPSHVPVVEPVNIEGREERRAQLRKEREAQRLKAKLSRLSNRKRVDPDIKLKMEAQQIYWEAKRKGTQ
jgi:hypothetical protein